MYTQFWLLYQLTTLGYLQEIKDLDELISEIGGELGKFAEEEKSQALSEIKELQVFLISESTELAFLPIASKRIASKCCNPVMSPHSRHL